MLTKMKPKKQNVCSIMLKSFDQIQVYQYLAQRDFKSASGQGSEQNSAIGVNHNQLNKKGLYMDITTTYIGMKLRSPLVVSASHLGDSIENLKKIEDCGGAAVVLHSLFEEQLRLEAYEIDHHLTHGTKTS